ncbi:uncharacterized protein LOC131856535 [Cryptomeria japonica]|uniref:uncharacterized protein LOC131856535 n=1 Tax=Cryptomeria japonica TaxID=3369 RepID=UPI0027D9E4E6|nr:uncharacterized protein LOC131856535 [Cryptomeria japonica]
MAQPDYTGEVNGAEQTQYTASAKSWIDQVKSSFDPSYKRWQVSETVCIYRMIEAIRISKPEAYDPLVISLGPYHHKNNKFPMMDQYKMEAIHRLSYAEEKNDNDKVCLNPVFQSKGRDNSLCSAILTDFIKLENQIPLFILTTLLELELKSPDLATTKLATMLSAIRIFNGSPFSYGLSEDSKEVLKKHLNKAPCHLLDLYGMVIRDFLAYPSAESGTAVECDDSVSYNINNGRGQCVPHITDERRSNPRAELLHKAGIEFQPGQLKFEKRLFGRGTFYLPQIKISVTTETRLRNLMAYEQCSYTLLRFLDNLIDSERDVSLLRKSFVIRSWAGSNEDIARMFNRLWDGITFSSSGEIDMIMKKARGHYNDQWKVLTNEFKQENCSKPWYVVPIVAAVLILGMTAVQTIYSVGK